MMDVMQKKQKVLIAEDDEVFRQVIRTLLEGVGFDVREAENGLVAKTILQLTRFDIVISDVKMPQMDGIKLLEYVKAHTSSRFIMMTGFSEVVEAQKASDLGADGFLLKPFRKEEILRVLKPPERPVDPRRAEGEYCQISITDLITGSEMPADIYLKLADDRFIRLASRGQIVAMDRISTYQEKGVNHLYMKKEDFARYVGFNMRLFNMVQTIPQIEIDRKMALFKHTTDNLMEQLCGGGMDRERLKSASGMVDSAVDLLLKNEDTMKLLDILMSAKSSSEHAMAVSMIACVIADEIGWTAKTTQFKITLSSLFHDIGEKEMPPELMTKRRFELSMEERRMLESHTVRGREILASVPGLPEDVGIVAAQHHETMTGTGYPYRLKGEQIHPIARLIAVANLFSELMLAGAGNKGMSAQQAYDTIRFDYQKDLDSDFVAGLGKFVGRLKKPSLSAS